MKNHYLILRRINLFLLTALMLIVSGNIFAQTPVTYTAGPTNAQINAVFGGTGSGVTVSGGNLRAGYRNDQIALFSGGFAAGLEIDEGIHFTTGNVVNTLKKNQSPGFTDWVYEDNGNSGSYSDAQMIALSPLAKYDAVVYEFNVKIANNATKLSITYQFGSEEFPDYVGTRYIDAFGFFVSGPGITGWQNLAKLPNGNPTTVNKVNYGLKGYYARLEGSGPNNDYYGFDGSQSALYINNGHRTTGTGGFLDGNVTLTNNIPVAVEFNGITKAITFDITGLTAGATYTFKIAIADAGANPDPSMNASFDSGVFIAKNSIKASADLRANNDTYSLTCANLTTASVLANDTYNGAAATTSNVTVSGVTVPTGFTVNSNGTITVASSVPAGTYDVIYRITDNLNNTTFADARSRITVPGCADPCKPSPTNPDSDGDLIADLCDWDDDNDGILDKDECIGFIANNVTGPWKGRTASNIIVSATPNMTQPNNQYVQIDPQVNFSVNQNGGDRRFGNTAYATSYVLTFSTPVPVNEIGLMIDDVNVTSQQSPNASFKIEVDFGSGFVNPNGVFMKTLAGRNAGVGFNALTGVPRFQDLPNPDPAGGEDIYLRGIGTTLVKAVRITGSNLGGTADSISYSFFALAPCDTDGDGIPNDLDLDSDGDGCVDAIEGAGNFITQDLTNPSGAVASQTPHLNFGTIKNDNGVPTKAAKGQGVGNSQNNALNDCPTCEIEKVNLNPYNDQSTSQSVFANNQIRIGNNRLSLSHTTTSSNFNTNRIWDNHFPGEVGIHIGHNNPNGLSNAQRIETTLSFASPISSLSFSVRDIDYGDSVEVLAYDHNNNLITLTPANYFIYSPLIITKSGNRFYDGQSPAIFQSADGSNDGTVDFNFKGHRISKVVFYFTDAASTGAYSIAKISGEICYFCTKPATTGTVNNPTTVGISTKTTQTKGWPENVPNGFITLESQTKGMVITRVDHVSFVPQASDSVTAPFAGMLVYDIEDDCVKLFNGINWKCIERSCNEVSN